MSSVEKTNLDFNAFMETPEGKHWTYLTQGLDLWPYGRCLLVKRDSPQTRSAAGIWFPEAVNDGQPERKEAVESGIVFRKGPGRRSDKTGRHLTIDVQPGDRVLFPYSAGEEIVRNGETFLLIWEDHVKAVVDPD